MRESVHTIVLSLLCAITAPAQQEDPFAALLPRETVVALDGPDLPAFVGAARAFVDATRARLGPPLRGLALLLGPMFESHVGLSLRALEDGAWPGAWCAAVVLHNGRPEPLVLVRGADFELPDPDAIGYGFAKEGDLLVLARSPAACEKYLAWHHNPDRTTLAARAPRRGAPASPSGMRVWVDLERIKGAQARQTLDPFGTLLFGPPTQTVARSTRLDGTVEIAPTEIQVDFVLDASAREPSSVVGKLLETRPRALPRRPAATDATFSLARRPTAFWANLDDLLDATGATQARAFVSIADTLMGGSFVDELTPAIDAPATLLVLAPSAEDDTAESPDTISLPRLALVIPRTERSVDPGIVKLFSTLLVVQRAEADLDKEVVFNHRVRRTREGHEIHVAEPIEWRGLGAAPVGASLTPSVALGPGHVVLASTESGAKDCLAALLGEADSAAPPIDSVSGDILRIDPRAVARFLRTNLPVIALDRVFETGHSEQRARRDLGFAATVLEAFDAVELSWVPGPDTTRITLSVELIDV